MSSERILFLPVLLSFLAACSIKEDRTACPCSLVLEISGLPVSPVLLEVKGEGCSITQSVHADTVLVLSVPKGKLTVSAVGGALAQPDGAVLIPLGEEAPPLWLFHADVPADVERVQLPVVLQKQYCTLELRFTGPPGYGPPFEVEVEGAADGWLQDGRPSEGSFVRRLSPGADGTAALRLPRQKDDSLLMHIVFSDRIVRSFALGSYMAAAGYDWSASGLDDLTLKVDISLTSVSLSSGLWSRTGDIELWI